MDNKHYKFLLGCIGLRIIITILAKNANDTQLKNLGALALIPAATFIILYLFDLRKTGFEAGGKIWWNSVRPIHGVLYLLFAIYALKSVKKSWIFLAIDVCLGIFFWYMKYHMNYFN